MLADSLFIDDPCYPLPDVGNATSGVAMVTIPGISGTVSVSHTCDPGHRFADGHRLMTSHCKSGKWELNHRRCDSKALLDLYFKLMSGPTWP